MNVLFWPLHVVRALVIQGMVLVLTRNCFIWKSNIILCEVSAVILRPVGFMPARCFLGWRAAAKGRRPD